MSVMILQHLARRRRARLREVAADHRERRDVERVDEQVERQRVVRVAGLPLDRVTDDDEHDGGEAGVVPERDAHARLRGARGQRARSRVRHGHPIQPDHPAARERPARARSLDTLEAWRSAWS